MPTPPLPPRGPNLKEDLQGLFRDTKKFIPKSKPPRKRSNAFKEKKMTEAHVTGELNAHRKFESKKSIKERVLEYFEKLLENIDPLEAIAILGGTIIVHDVIFKMAEFSTELSKVNPVVLGISAVGGGLAGGTLLALFDVWSQVQVADTYASEEKKKEVEAAKRKLNSDIPLQIVLWLMAFTVSYIAIKHGDDLLEAAKSCFGMISV